LEDQFLKGSTFTRQHNNTQKRKNVKPAASSGNVTEVFKGIKVVFTFRLPLLSTSLFHYSTAGPLGKRKTNGHESDYLGLLSQNQAKEAKKLHV
jgi:hypothetical protein